MTNTKYKHFKIEKVHNKICIFDDKYGTIKCRKLSKNYVFSTTNIYLKEFKN